MWPLGFVTALGLRVSASVGGCLWGNFLLTLSKHWRGPCGPWRLLYFPPMEAKVSSRAPFGSCDFFSIPCASWNGDVLLLNSGGNPASLPRDPGPFSGEKNLYLAPQGGGWLLALT